MFLRLFVEAQLQVQRLAGGFKRQSQESEGREGQGRLAIAAQVGFTRELMGDRDNRSSMPKRNFN